MKTENLLKGMFLGIFPALALLLASSLMIANNMDHRPARVLYRHSTESWRQWPDMQTPRMAEEK